MNILKQRLYSIVLRHLSGIQKGIQHGHSKDIFEERFSFKPEYKKWLTEDKTVIVLETNSVQQLLNAASELTNAGIEVGTFLEEDLSFIPTSISFLVDEKVWDFETYPNISFITSSLDNRTLRDAMQLEANTNVYGKEISFLKQFIRKFNLASN